MTRFAPIRTHEGLARGALVLALLTGWGLAATVDVGPPDYALPFPSATDDAVAALTGAPPDSRFSFQSVGSRSTTTLATGDEVHVGYAWSDHLGPAPQSEHVVAREALHRCVRIVVTSTGIDLDPSRVDDFLDTLRHQLDEYLDGLPHDPCAGRPLAP